MGRKCLLFVCAEALLLLIFSQLTDLNQAKVTLVTALNMGLLVPASIVWWILNRPTPTAIPQISNFFRLSAFLVLFAAIMIISLTMTRMIVGPW